MLRLRKGVAKFGGKKPNKAAIKLPLRDGDIERDDEHRLKNAVNRYNSIFRVQLPKITPHICRHTYCSNQAKAGMNPKTLQYLMGHSDIGVTMNTYTHLGLDDAKNEMIRMEELEQARKEVDKAEDKKPMKQNMFKVV